MRNPIACIVLLAVCLCRAQNGPEPQVKVHFPPDKGVVYGRPHVLVIFDIVGSFESLSIRIDGREIPKTVFTYCKICAGDHTAILTSDAYWGATQGIHKLAVEAQEPGGKRVSITRNYSVDDTRPALDGLSGHIGLPDAFVAADRSVLLGASSKDGKIRGHGIIGVASSTLLPFEIAAGDGVSWKAQLAHSGSWGLAGGEVLGDHFGVLSFKTEPSKVALTVGVGAGNMPRGWVGASYVLTGMTQRSHGKGLVADALAVSELVAIEFEVDDRGRANYGATLVHPYGWSAGLYRVNICSRPGWRFQATYRFQIK